MHLVLLALCAYRLWRLVGKDDITASVRSRMPGVVLRGVTCPWCLGTWTALALVVFDHYRPVSDWVLLLGAVACVVGLIGERLDNDAG